MMGMVHTEIILINAEDKTRAKDGSIGAEEIRQTTVDALVDTGAYTLVINEDLRERLGLDIKGISSGTLANGARRRYDHTSPLEIIWKDRDFTVEAVIIPGAREVLQIGRASCRERV